MVLRCRVVRRLSFHLQDPIHRLVLIRTIQMISETQFGWNPRDFKLTGLSTSLAPGYTSGGYGKVACSAANNLGNTVFLGLGTIFLRVERRASLVAVRTARVAATEEPTIRLMLRVGSDPKSRLNGADMAVMKANKRVNRGSIG